MTGIHLEFILFFIILPESQSKTIFSPSEQRYSPSSETFEEAEQHHPLQHPGSGPGAAGPERCLPHCRLTQDDRNLQPQSEDAQSEMLRVFDQR